MQSSGQYPEGDETSDGHMTSEPAPAGRVNTGQMSAGQVPTGQVPTGQVSTGPMSTGQVPTGQVSTGRVLPHYEPLRSRTRTIVLFFLALGTGVLMSASYHYLQYRGLSGPGLVQTRHGLSAVNLGVDLCLGILALALLPSAIQHNPLERLDTYIGPPSALVASLVILCVWMVSTLAAPAGAVVLISVSARLSRAWTASAFCASFLSLIVNQLTTFGAGGVSAMQFVLGGCVLTLVLIAMGSVRGVLLRRE